MLPNRDAFRAFLRLGSPRKKLVTLVTPVTLRQVNDLRSYTDVASNVTPVTAEIRSDQECSDPQERQAIAEIEGGVPPLYSGEFARLQLTPPAGLSVHRLLQAVDDAGRFLDGWGLQAQALGWTPQDLFGPAGLVRDLSGTKVVALSSYNARLSDGRVHPKAPTFMKESGP